MQLQVQGYYFSVVEEEFSIPFSSKSANEGTPKEVKVRH